MKIDSAHSEAAAADLSPARPIRTLAALGLLWSACSFAVLIAGRWLPGSGTAATSAASAAGFILLAARGSEVYLRRVEPFLSRRNGLRVILILGCFVFGAGIFLLVRQDLLPPTPAFVFGSANLLIFANLVGSWLVCALRRPAELVPVCAVMASADLLSLWAGPTRVVVRQLEGYYRRGMEGPVPIAKFFLVQVAVPGLERPLPLFGVADWIMVVLLLCAMSRFGFDDNLAGLLRPMKAGGADRPRLYLPVPAVGLAAAVLAAQGFGLFLPALPVVGAVFLAFLLLRFPCARSLRRIDWSVLLLVGALVALAGVRRLELL